MQLNSVTISHWIALTGYFGLVIGIYVWHMWIKQTPDHAISIMLIVQLGPLMFPLRGLLAGKIYTHAWSMYLAIFYFVVGALAARILGMVVDGTVPKQWLLVAVEAVIMVLAALWLWRYSARP